MMKLISPNEQENLEIGVPEYKSTVENSLQWRLWHSINYMLGGLLFPLGSLCYYPAINPIVNGDVLGGWLFTIGSLGFLFADLTEWNHYKLGCVSNSHYQSDKKYSNSFSAAFRRAELGINFFFSAIGSFLYLLGSIFFIPATNMLPPGENLFIYGSLIIFFSQLWKCVRTSCTNEQDPNDNKIRYENIMADFRGFMVDFWAGMGGLFYYIGTYLFKTMITTNNLIFAVHFWVLGGISFFLSGIFMQFRYYSINSKNVKIEPKNTNANEENDLIIPLIKKTSQNI